MWTLTSKKDGQTFYLLPEKEKYIVGRSNSDLILKEDSSISRNHAWIYPEDDHVSVVDVGSKYGTFYNHNIENKVPMIKNVKIELKIGERIQFGQLGNEWVLSQLNICTLTSALTAEDRSAVQRDLAVLRGKIIDTWSESCTHLTMSMIAVTEKVLYALIANIPIVSVGYWKAYHKELQARNRPPSPHSYIPPLGESFLNKDSVSFAPNESRKSIFSGKVFFLMSKRHLDTYEPIITKAGGICKDLSKGVPKVELVKKTSIVIQYASTSLSQSSQTIDSIADFMKQSGRRLIPDCEIGLAIIYCSMEKYCNPEFDIVGALIPETPLSLSNKDIIAPRSQQDEIIAPKSQLDKIIARRTQVDVDINILSVEIPDTATGQSDNKRISSGIDLFGNDDYVDNILRDIPDSEMETGTLKRKRERSVELPKKKFISERSPSALNSVQDMPAHSEKENSVVIQGSTSFSKSIGNIEKRVGYMDLSDFLSKNTIAKRPRIPEPEDSIMEERSKKPKLVFSSDEEDNEIMVTWDYAQKIDFGKKRPGSAAQEKSIKIRKCKTPERTIIPIKKPVVKEPQIRKDPANFKSKLNSTGWISAINLKKENIEESDNEDEKLGKPKNDWIDSIKGGFEVRVKSMLLNTKCFRDVSENGENSMLNRTNGKNFKAFVKKQNYRPQSTVIRTEPFVVMNA